MNSDPPKGCEIKLPNESDINNWEVHMEGPPDSPYAVSACFETRQTRRDTDIS